MRASLTKRDGFRLRAWQAGLVAVIFAMALGMIRSGASWGSSGYDPASDPYSMPNITAADGAQAWWKAGYTGQGVDVALIDTGVSPVAGLNAPGKLVYGPDLSLESQNPSLRNLDTNGHGTFMAGLIAGNDGQTGGYRGVAPGARILSVKVGDADGGVDVSQVIAAIDWIVQHRNDNGMNIRVINLSYGTNSTQAYTVDPLAYAVEQAWKAGIVVVAAAGNSGYQTGASAQGLADPAYDPEILAVGAADTMGTGSSNDEVASFSANAASCSKACRAPDLVAPGTHMQGLRVPGSYIDQNNPAGVLGDSYFRGSGTSEATAFVSGAVALLVQKYPDLTPDQVKAMLTTGCAKLHGYNRKEQGCGELDLNRLLPVHEPPLLSPNQYLARWGAKALSTGTGSLEASRGTDHISFNGIELQGEQDIFGMPFDSAATAALEASGSSWSGGMWNGSLWTGSSWSGSSWSGSSWSGSGWPGSSWSGSSWSGSSWSGSSWSGSSWSGSSWSGSSWSGGSWLGASWG